MKSRDSACSIIAVDKFIQATRDSGYKGTASAISELVDNAIQAGASHIAISIGTTGSPEKDKSIEISVLDNGTGMDAFTLRLALRFGGSTRFGDRGGLGRYGMGLPNASLSQARRVTVYTWRHEQNKKTVQRSRQDNNPQTVLMSYLDVDEIMNGKIDQIPPPQVVIAPKGCDGRSGSLVVWSRCDRLDNVRISTIARKIETELGRRFRHFLFDRLRIFVNGKPIIPFDPLYLHPKSRFCGAHIFGKEFVYEVRAGLTGDVTGTVRVRFSELPVHEWYRFSNEEKRRIGITQGAGVSIVRAGREVDHGWFFMGAKHRENYDDWWRCEIQFDPVLDEAFGITHTKQQIRPTSLLFEALVPDLEATARALNSRVRKTHSLLKSGERFSEAERLANERHHLLKPLPSIADRRSKQLMMELQKSRLLNFGTRRDDPHYKIVECPLSDTGFFNYGYDGHKLVLVLNTEHPFYREIYKPLLEANTPAMSSLRVKIELVLLAAARSELIADRDKTKWSFRRREWSNTVATFLNDK